MHNLFEDRITLIMQQSSTLVEVAQRTNDGDLCVGACCFKRRWCESMESVK